MTNESTLVHDFRGRFHRYLVFTHPVPEADIGPRLPTVVKKLVSVPLALVSREKKVSIVPEGEYSG